MSNTTKLSVWMSSTSTVRVFISLTILNARRRQPVTASSFALTVTRPCSPGICCCGRLLASLNKNLPVFSRWKVENLATVTLSLLFGN